ncbi:hypothetical protein ACFE04_011927 [Oxalis oulophora]
MNKEAGSSRTIGINQSIRWLRIESSLIYLHSPSGRWDDIMMSCISAFAQNARDLYIVFADILLLVMRKHGGVTAVFVFGRTVICRDMDVATRVARNDGLDVAKSKGDSVVVLC